MFYIIVGMSAGILFTHKQRNNHKKLCIPQYFVDWATPLHPEIQTGFSGKICCAQKRNTECRARLSQYAASTNLNTGNNIKKHNVQNQCLMQKLLNDSSCINNFSVPCCVFVISSVYYENKTLMSTIQRYVTWTNVKMTNNHNVFNSSHKIC